MKNYRLHGMISIILLSLISGLVLAQGNPPDPAPTAMFDYNRDRIQYSGQDAPLDPTTTATFDYSRDRFQYSGEGTEQEPTSVFALPATMEIALVPCGDNVTGACDLIATKPEDIVGVWKQYLGGPRFNTADGMAYIRYNADGSYVIANSVENTAQPYEGYPSGTYHFDGIQFVIGPAAGAPPPCDIPPHYQLRVLKYGDQPVALRYVSIDDRCTNRLQDLSQALVWVSQ
jgi:hypothetical protein